jgi:signal transduction histidine kinase
MSQRSIRFQMTFWYSSVMAVTLLVVGIAIERLAYNRISASIDNSLRRGAHAVINEFALLDGDVMGIPEDSTTTILNPPPWPPWYVQLVDLDMNVFYRSRNLGLYELPIDTSAIHGVRRGMVIAPDMQLHNNEPIRLITFRLPEIRGRDDGWGQVALSLNDLVRARKKNRKAQFFIIPPGIVISMLLGGWLSRRALRPIDSVTSTARRIRASNLHERLPGREVDDELGRLVDTLNELFERLELNFEQISRFSADVSHELRTPLTIIQGEAEVALRSGAGVTGKQQALEVILDEALRMSKLVRNLLTLANLETGQRRPDFTLIQIRPIVEDLAEEAQVMVERKDITLSIEINGDAEVLGDSVLLHQLGFNLLDNAVKYTPTSGSVALKLNVDSKSAQLSVRDSGIGIDQEELPLVFDRFFRSDKARNHGSGGSGLGLSLVKQIVDIHRGKVSVSSTPGEGSEFVVELPIDSAGSHDGLDKVAGSIEISASPDIKRNNT